MTQYPIEFQSVSSAQAGVEFHWTTQVSFQQEIAVSIPPEFHGPGGRSSPEDLFNAALVNCFIGTFKVMAANSKVTFQELSVSSRLQVDLDEHKKPVMKDFFLKAVLVNPSNPERALLLAKKAAESGFILNSVKTQCHFDFQVASSPGG